MASEIAIRMLIQAGRALGELTDADFTDFGQAITEREARLGRELKHYHHAVYASRAVVYHLGAPAEPVPRRSTPGRWSWERHLDGVPPQVRRPMTAYLERLQGTHARSSVQGTASELAHFGRFLARHDPGLPSLALLDRQRHIEPYLNEVAAAVNHRTGQPIAASTAKARIQAVGSFLDAIAEWGWPEAPARRLIFPRDAPKLPHPLPRYLPPDQERALLRALEDSPNRLYADALLLRRATGMRIGELVDLELDCVHEAPGSGAWLKIPLGKLLTERMVPIDEETLELVDRIVTHRSAGRPLRHPRTGKLADFLLTHQGRRVSADTLREELRRAAAEAGLDSVVPHQLRHTYATELANAGMSLQALMALLGHYAGDLVKLIMLGGCLAEAGQQPVEDFLPPGLALGGGVVALLFEGGAERDGGLEERARFADGFEVAVQAGGAGAVAVAEHPLVHFGAELAHLVALGAGGQVLRGVVEGLDLFRHCEVLLGDGAVGDAGIHHGDPHRSMTQEGSYDLEAHAPVDGLGGQRVPEPVRADVADPGGAGGFGDGPVDAALPDALAVLGEQVRAAQAGGPPGEPGVEEVFELGVQRDVTVGAQLAERHVQPVSGADLHHGVDGEVEELAFAQAGAGQELHGQADERVGVGAGGLQQLGECRVVEEAGQRLVAQRQVAGEHQHPGGDVAAVPFGEPLEAGAQGAEVLGEADLGQVPAAGRGPAGQVQLVVLDVAAAEVGDAGDLRGVASQPAGELAQHALDADHGRGSQRQAHLGDVAGQGGCQARRRGCPLRGPFSRAVRAGLARSGAEHAEVEQGDLQSEQCRAQRPGPVAAGPVPADGGGQRLPALVDDGLGHLIGGQPGQRRHLGQRRPLQAGHGGPEAEPGGGGG